MVESEKWTYTRSTSGTLLKLVLTEGNLTVTWTEKVHGRKVAVVVESVRRMASSAMDELKEATKS